LNSLFVDQGDYTDFLRFKRQENSATEGIKMKERETFTSFTKIEELEKENRELSDRLEKYKSLTKNLNQVILQLKEGRLMDRKPWHNKNRPPTFCQIQGRVNHLSEVPRLKRVAGQVLGVAQIIIDGRNFSCVQLLDQIKSIKESLNNIGSHILLRHLDQCLEQDYKGLKYPEQKEEIEKRGYKEEFRFERFINGQRKWRWDEEKGRMVSRGMAKKN